jgi:hypothetical protein
MKKIRKFEMDFVSEEMISQLELKELVMLRISKDFRLMDFEGEDFEEHGEFLIDQLANWKTFIKNNCQLKALHMPDCKLSIEHLQILLENLPLLRYLKVKVDHYNYGFAVAADHHESSREEYWAKYEVEQAEKAAKLIGEKYDNFRRLVLKCWSNAGKNLTECLELHQPKVKISKKEIYNVLICKVMK